MIGKGQSRGCLQLSLDAPAWQQVPEQVQVQIHRAGSSVGPLRTDVHLACFIAILPLYLAQRSGSGLKYSVEAVITA